MTDDDQQFDDIYRQEADALRRFLRRKLANAADAEETLQEAYLRLHRTMKKVEIVNIRGFLYRIATNLVIDRYRSAKHNARHVELDELPQSTHELISAERSPEEQSIIREQLRVTLETIRGLPPRCQQVFVLHRIKQMTHKEISRELGISTQMVEKHIAKAVRICTERILPYR